MTGLSFDPGNMACCLADPAGGRYGCDCPLLVNRIDADAGEPYCRLAGPHGPSAEAVEYCERFTPYARAVELAAGVAAVIARIHNPVERAHMAESFADFMAGVVPWFDRDEFFDIARPVKVVV